MDATIELTDTRTVSLQERGTTFAIRCRRVGYDDWKAFFESILSTTETEGKDSIRTVDLNSARLELADRVITGAAGYVLRDGTDLMQKPDWKARIPMAHRLAVGGVLTEVSLSANVDDGEFRLPIDGEEVLLDCTWSAGDDGKMQRFTGLRHIFALPTADQQRRYARESSRSRIVGGSRKGKTVWMGAQLTLAKLYDELIQSVDGYTVNGMPIEGRDTIAREMDTLHKVEAAMSLFNPASALKSLVVREEEEE